MFPRFICSVAKQASKTPLRSHPLPATASTSRWLSSEADESSADSFHVGKVVRFVPRAKGFGFIHVDGYGEVFAPVDHIKKLNIEGESSFNATLRPKMSVQLKIKTNEEGKHVAHEITLEGGKLIRPFQKDYIERFAVTRKGRFGAIVFDIMESVSDQAELEKKIVEAFDNAKDEITKQKAKVERILAAYDEAEK
jgi:cold shock CspA family protein